MHNLHGQVHCMCVCVRAQAFPCSPVLLSLQSGGVVAGDLLLCKVHTRGVYVEAVFKLLSHVIVSNEAEQSVKICFSSQTKQFSSHVI